MYASAEQQRSTLFDCYGKQKPEILADLSAEDRRQIERYFWRNIHSGRAHKMRQRAARKSPASNQLPTHAQYISPTGRNAAAESAWLVAYLQSIVEIFQQEKTLLNALAQRESAAWGKLVSRLALATYRLLIEMGVARDHAQEVSSDIAHAVCGQVGRDLYPCDVPFDTWVHGLLNQQILHQLTYQSEPVPVKPSLDTHPRMSHEPQMFMGHAPPTQTPYRTFDMAFQVSMQPVDSDLLAHAIGQLPSVEQRMAIVYHCYYNLSAAEIAHRMGKTKDDVRTLCRSALRNLQGIMQS